jgi:hypothetical protein
MRRHFLSALFAPVACAACLALPAMSQPTPLPTASPQDRAEAREIFKQLIEINTTDTPKGSVTAA